MPELPEIETIRRSLDALRGAQMCAVTLSQLAPLAHASRADFRAMCRDKKIRALERIGKYLLLRLDSTTPQRVIIHLGMSGQLRLFTVPTSEKFSPQSHAPLPPHTHAVFTFANGDRLAYIDARRFGRLSLSRTDDGRDNPLLAALGPDYLDPQLSEKSFLARCRRHPKLNLKALALDQRIAAGLGNIYACEALYHARLDPRRAVYQCSDTELARLFAAAQHALALGIAHGGTTLRDYFDGQGARGRMQDFLCVYGKAHDATAKNSHTILRITQAGRSTWFDPTVQR